MPGPVRQPSFSDDGMYAPGTSFGTYRREPVQDTVHMPLARGVEAVGGRVQGEQPGPGEQGGGETSAARFCRAVNDAYRPGPSTKPATASTAESARPTGTPRISRVPASATASPSNRPSGVVFPAPFGQTRPDRKDRRRVPKDPCSEVS